MSIVLNKGGNINLSKEAPGLCKIRVGLGWDVRSTDGLEFDLDSMALLVNQNGHASNDSDLVFYNNLKHSSSAVEHMGDNRTGEGTGDDESIVVDLTLVPELMQRVLIAVSIHEAEERKQNFGQVSNAFIRVSNEDNNVEMARYDLSEDASIETLIVFGEVYRYGKDWKFRAVGQGYRDGLRPFLQQHGFSV